MATRNTIWLVLCNSTPHCACVSREDAEALADRLNVEEKLVERKAGIARQRWHSWMEVPVVRVPSVKRNIVVKTQET